MIILNKGHLSELAGAIIGMGIDNGDQKTIDVGRFLDNLIENNSGELDELNELQKKANVTLFKFE